MTLLDAGSVGHLKHLDLVVEEMGRSSHHLPGQGCRAHAGAVDVTPSIGCERPGGLPLLGERLQLVLWTREWCLDTVVRILTCPKEAAILNNRRHNEVVL